MGVFDGLVGPVEISPWPSGFAAISSILFPFMMLKYCHRSYAPAGSIEIVANARYCAVPARFRFGGSAIAIVRPLWTFLCIPARTTWSNAGCASAAAVWVAWRPQSRVFRRAVDRAPARAPDPVSPDLSAVCAVSN